jgi:hypothetical protein
LRRHLNSARSANPVIYVLIGVGVIAMIVLVCALSSVYHNNNVRACKQQGGTVVTDTDHDRYYDKKTGKQKTRTTTEHECIINGREVNEW